MVIKYKKHHKRKKHKQKLDQIVNFRSFAILGVVFLMLGTYFSLSTSESFFVVVYKMVQGFFISSGPVEEVATIPTGSGLGDLLVYSLPALLLSGLSSWYAKKHPVLSYAISFLVVIYFILLQIGIFTCVINTGDLFVYPILACIFLIISTSILYLSAYVHNKSGLLYIVIFYFYITTVIYSASIVPYRLLATCVAIFSLTITWTSLKIRRPTLNLTNYIFSLGFISLFFIRKLVINSRPDFLTEFLIVGVILYLIFYLIVIYSSNTKGNRLRIWMQSLISWSALLLFLGASAFVLTKYSSTENVSWFVLGLLIFHVAGLYLVKQFAENARIEIYYHINIFLAALLLSLVIPGNDLFIFSIACSVLLLLYNTSYKNKITYFLSLGSMVFSFGLFLLLWLIDYLPALFSNNLQPVLAGSICVNLLMSASLILTIWQLKNKESIKLKNKYNPSYYLQLTILFFHISSFLGLGWILSTLVYLFSKSVNYLSIAWFISGCCYFIAAIRYYAGKKSTFKRPILYIAYLFTLLSPQLLSWNFASKNIIFSGRSYPIALLFHYLAISLLIILSIMTIKRIFLRNRKKVYLLQGVQILTILCLTVFTFIEYDNIFILVKHLQNSEIIHAPNITGLMTYNKYLPYSICIWLLSVTVFIFANFKSLPFLRKSSLLLFLAGLVKFIAFDFIELNPSERSITFFILGVLLIFSALLYHRLRKTSEKKGSM